MKTYRLWDYYEDYGLIGDYDTKKEAEAAAKQHSEDTDCECQIVLYVYCGVKKGYKVIT
jgi:hypothetical protein